jgi:serine/threonine protein kinase
MSVAIKVLVNVGRREGTREYRALQTVKNIRHAHMVPVFGVWLKASDGTCLGEADVAEAGRRILGNHGAAGAESVQQAPLELIVAMGLGDGTLYDRLQASVRAGATGLPPEQLLDWMRQAALALDHFNAGARTATGGAAAVQHCDIKPQNILFNKASGTLKLADFGLARAFMIPIRAYTHEVVTLWYRAPDVLMGNKRYSTPVDVWALGCIFAEMHNGRPLFPGANDSDQLDTIFKELGTPDTASYPLIVALQDYKPASYHSYPKPASLAHLVPGLSPEGVDLFQRFLEIDPEKRISTKEALEVSVCVCVCFLACVVYAPFFFVSA